jgi:hypothetical protein
LADEYYVASWGKALEKAGIGAEKIKSAMDSAINDAMSSVGRNRQSLDAFKEEATNMRDAGTSIRACIVASGVDCQRSKPKQQPSDEAFCSYDLWVCDCASASHP